MLTVRDLRVEVGGVVLLDGVGFTVRGGDKVGLVGRNGAGKTTMLKILGDPAPPAHGSIRRDGGVGYLPQDPRLDDTAAARTGLEHVLSGRGLDEAVVRMEKLRVAMEEDPSDRAVARYSRAEERFRLDGGYQADSEVRRLAVGPRAWPTTASTSPSPPSPAASGAGWSWPASSSPAATCSSSTSPPTTSTPTPRTGCWSTCAATGAACWSSATTSTCSTRPSPG